MKLRVTGKNVDIGESLRAHVESRTEEALHRHFNGSYTGHVTVEKERSEFRTECAIHLASGVTLQAVGTSHDPYQSTDQAIGRIERRLQRHKRRLKDRHPHADGREAVNEGAAYSVFEALSEEEDVPDDFNPIVIAESTHTFRTLPVSDAVLELDLTDKPFIVFRHAGHGGINVVYKRHDGNVGWIDPSLPQA